MMRQTILNLPRSTKRLIALVVDICLCLATVALSFWFRLDQWIIPEGPQWLAYSVAIVVFMPIFVKFGLYRAIFRYAGWAALESVTKACALYGLIYVTIFTSIGVPGVPKTIGVLQPLLFLIASGSARAGIRYWLGSIYRIPQRTTDQRRVIVYGAGAAGRQLATAASNSNQIRTVAFVDDDRNLLGGTVGDLVIHAPGQLGDLIREQKVDEVLLAIPSSNRRKRHEIIEHIMEQAAGRRVAIRTLPSLLDLAHGEVTVSNLREVEIDDLLGRDPVPPNRDLLARDISDKIVMVTGAGGSIGSELCVQIIAQRPKKLVLVDFSEFNLYSIHRRLKEIAAADPDVGAELVPVLATVQSRKQIDSIVAAWRPDTIYHAAAYKHVPMVEFNVAEGIRNNVFGTLNVTLAAIAYGVLNLVLISTDKAVRPTNVMGATKRLAEQVLQALSAENAHLNLSMVRFGNVLGSSGSVVPLFREQIKAGGPVTLTHTDVTRFFMTIPEAAQLVIQAGAMAKGGEVFVLDMGEPVKIIDLARMMIELSGLAVRSEDNPDGDIEIRTIGMRPGEKLYEELLIGDNPQPTGHTRIMKAAEKFPPWCELTKSLDVLLTELQGGNSKTLVDMLAKLVPEYRPEVASASAEPISPDTVSDLPDTFLMPSNTGEDAISSRRASGVF